MTEPSFVVAGGSGGIGRALISILAAEGISTVNFDRSMPADEPAGSETHIVDLSSAKALRRLATKLSRRPLRVVALAVTAGSGTRAAGGESMETFEAELHANLALAFAVCTELEPFLLPASSIVLFSSITSIRSFASSIGYTSAKAGIVGLTKALALRLAARAIRVNCLVLGLIAPRRHPL